MSAIHARGACLLRLGRHSDAIESFQQALELYPGHAQSHIGLALALGASGSPERAESITRRLPAIVESLTGARPIEAALVESQILAIEGKPDAASATLCRLLESAPPGFAAWTIPVEPWLHQLYGTKEFTGVLHRLAERAH
jgi:hypothetical protein